VFLASDGNVEESVVVGDEMKIFSKSKSIYEAIILLVGTYYVVDLHYLKPFCNILGLLQQFVVGEGYTGDRSSAYTRFVKDHNAILSS